MSRMSNRSVEMAEAAHSLTRDQFISAYGAEWVCHWDYAQSFWYDTVTQEQLDQEEAEWSAAYYGA